MCEDDKKIIEIILMQLARVLYFFAIIIVAFMLSIVIIKVIDVYLKSIQMGLDPVLYWWYAASPAIILSGGVSAFSYQFYRRKNIFEAVKVIFINAIGIIVVGHTLTYVAFWLGSTVVIKEIFFK